MYAVEQADVAAPLKKEGGRPPGAGSAGGAPPVSAAAPPPPRLRVPCIVGFLLRWLCLYPEYHRRRAGRKRGCCMSAVQGTFFLLDHAGRFAFWTSVLHVRYHLPLSVTASLALVVLNGLLFFSYPNLRSIVGSKVFRELLAERALRQKLQRSLTFNVVAMSVFYVFILIISYVPQATEIAAGDMSEPLPAWLLVFYLSSYHLFFLLTMIPQVSMNMAVSGASIVAVSAVVENFAKDIKTVLLEGGASVDASIDASVDAEQGRRRGRAQSVGGDALLLEKLEHIQSSSEARLHTFREIPKNLLQVGMAGFCASLVMVVLSLLPTTWGNTQRIAGVSITMLVGLSIFVQMLWLASRQNAAFLKARRTTLNDPRLMQVCLRLFGGRQQFLEWLTETELSAMRVADFKVTSKLLLQIGSLVISLSGTAAFIAARTIVA